jgi:chitinase
MLASNSYPSSRMKGIIFLFIFLGACCFHGADASSIGQHTSNRRILPEKILVGYSSGCDGQTDDMVAQVVREGVNVVIWAFMSIKQESDGTINPKVSWDLDCVRQTIEVLDREGYNDTVHLVSFGGWNGGHLDPYLTADEWYGAWNDSVGSVFHGIDWDLEGDDEQLDNPRNFFTMDCLEKMGQISQLAKEDGYIISMAPPQSYLDLQTSNFSRYVNLTEPTRPWHNEFHYFGANVYAYVLAKYGDYIDFISVQFYESYSRAAMSLRHYGISQEAYLEFYVNELAKNGQTYFVSFGEDPTVDLSSQKVSVPVSKLVFGFFNGSPSKGTGKVAFFEPERVGIAYENLLESGIEPRGFMFWNIQLEGRNDFNITPGLNKILKIREGVSQQQQATT